MLAKLKNECAYTYDAKFASTISLKDLQIKLKEEKAKIKKAKASQKKVKTHKAPSKRELTRIALAKELCTLMKDTPSLYKAYDNAKISELRKEIARIKKAQKPKKEAKPKD